MIATFQIHNTNKTYFLCTVSPNHEAKMNMEVLKRGEQKLNEVGIYISWQFSRQNPCKQHFCPKIIPNK